MAEKLKSISRQIHWFLLARAAVFALSWFIFPFWLFLAVALYLYFVPLFQAGKLAVPFFGLLILTYIEPADAAYLLIFALFFYYLILIKDLLLIDRKGAYELLVLALSFFFFRDFYERFGAAGISPIATWYAFLVAAFFGLLAKSFMNALKEPEAPPGKLPMPAGWLSFVVAWQFLLIGLFLPLSFTYQSVLMFFISILIIDLIPEYAATGKLLREKILATSTAVFVLIAIVLASARWTI